MRPQKKSCPIICNASQAVLPSSMHACLTKTRCLQKKKKKVHPAWPSPTLSPLETFLTLMDSKLLAD